MTNGFIIDSFSRSAFIASVVERALVVVNVDVENPSIYRVQSKIIVYLNSLVHSIHFAIYTTALRHLIRFTEVIVPV